MAEATRLAAWLISQQPGRGYLGVLSALHTPLGVLPRLKEPHTPVLPGIAAYGTRVVWNRVRAMGTFQCSSVIEVLGIDAIDGGRHDCGDILLCVVVAAGFCSV